MIEQVLEMDHELFCIDSSQEKANAEDEVEKLKKAADIFV